MKAESESVVAYLASRQNLTASSRAGLILILPWSDSALHTGHLGGTLTERASLMHSLQNESNLARFNLGRSAPTPATQTTLHPLTQALQQYCPLEQLRAYRAPERFV